MLGFWSCFGKKPSRPSLEEFIPQATGGELTYVSSIVDLDPRRLFDHKKKILLADSRDSLVQLTTTVYTSEPDYDLDIASVRETLGVRRAEKRQAEVIYAALESSGLPGLSVSVVEGHVYILLYAEPTPASRQSVTDALAGGLRGFAAFLPVKLWLEWMEPSARGEATGPIIPYGYWQRGDSYHDGHKILSAAVEWREDLTGQDLAVDWTINTGSERIAVYEKTAFSAAKAWAAKDSSRPSDFRDDQFRTWADPDHPLLVHFAFPIGPASPDNQSEEPETYVTGVFDPDQGTFTKIHLTDTL